MPRHFLRDDDLTPAVFDKPSLRTRVSFSVGITELGGYPLVIDTQVTHFARGEPVEDAARVLSRQVVAIAGLLEQT